MNLSTVFLLKTLSGSKLLGLHLLGSALEQENWRQGERLSQSERSRQNALRWQKIGLTASLAAIGAVGSLSLDKPGLALPEVGQVQAGSAQIELVNPDQMNINQQSDRAVINWQSFSVGKDQSVNFQQPSATSATLNRVTGNERSDIAGRITANGTVMLVNPNGILFGPTAVVDVGGLMATTLSIRDQDFMSGKYSFQAALGKPAATVENFGQITVREGGFAALVAPGVANSGVINARLGQVTLASGTAATLDFYGDGLISLAVDPTLAENLQGADGKPLTARVNQSGTINADGGVVSLSARAGKAVVDTAINMSGAIQARSVSNRNGEIVLSGEGNVTVTGKLDTSGAAGQSGGNIFLSSDGAIDTSKGSLNANSDTGKGGGIYLSANNDITTSDLNSTGGGSNGSIVLESYTGKIDTTAGSLNSGAIDLEAAGDIRTANISSRSTTGDSSSISLLSDGAINTSQGSLDSSSDTGKAGSIYIAAKGGITTSHLKATGTVNNGSITLDSATGKIDTTAGSLNGGRVSIDAASDITTGAISSHSASDNGGNISLISGSTIDTSKGILDSSSETGNSGDIYLAARSNIVTGNLSSTGALANGTINLYSLTGKIDATAGTINGGTVTLDASSDVKTANINSRAASDGGKISITSGGTIDITSGNLSARSSSDSVDKGKISLAAKGNIAIRLLSSGTPYGNAGSLTLFSKEGEIVLNSDYDLSAVITNGNVRLGVFGKGNLGGSRVGIDLAGLGDAIMPGCLCEGWGIAGNGIAGGASASNSSPRNLKLTAFSSTPSTATSTVTLSTLPSLQITQAYLPALEAPTALFEDRVTITNKGSETISDIRYTRAMDWDVPPNPFNEYVTISGREGAKNVLYSSNNGFSTVNPLEPKTYTPYYQKTETGEYATDANGNWIEKGAETVNADFVDAGSGDHGAVFDLGFGDLASNRATTFSIYYGATTSEATAIGALTNVKAEMFSLGQSSPEGSPGTFIFGFKSVGGKPLGVETPPILFPNPFPAPVNPPIADSNADKIDIDESVATSDKSDSGSVTITDASPDPILLTDSRASSDLSKPDSIAAPDTNNSNVPDNLPAPTNLDNVSNEYFVSYLFPTDWLDYIGLGYDVAERIYIEFNYKEGQEKDFQRFVNTLYFVIDAVLAASPGAGGGGLAVRSSHELAVAGWRATPASVKLKIQEELAKRMGWSVAKAAQMTNTFFSASSSESEGGRSSENDIRPEDAELETEAKRISAELYPNDKRAQSSRTIAVGRVIDSKGGVKKVVSSSFGAFTKEQSKKLQQQGYIVIPNQRGGNRHAEERMINWADSEIAQGRIQKIDAIGVSHPDGICSYFCKPLLQQRNIRPGSPWNDKWKPSPRHPRYNEPPRQ